MADAPQDSTHGVPLLVIACMHELVTSRRGEASILGVQILCPGEFTPNSLLFAKEGGQTSAWSDNTGPA